MCPFRVLVIFLSLLIALFATMAAMAKDPLEEEAELAREGKPAPPKGAWFYFVDFWSGRYLYRETKRLLPWCFAKDEPASAAEGEAAEGETAAAEEAEEQEQQIEGQPSGSLARMMPLPDAPQIEGLVEPSAPPAEEEAGGWQQVEGLGRKEKENRSSGPRQRCPLPQGIVGAVIS